MTLGRYDPWAMEDPPSFEELQNQLRSVLGSLSSAERMVIELRFGLTGDRAMTLPELESRLGIAREEIRRAESMALAKVTRR
jgi:DNA-directed RNA polymerase sigma subunit (sigma70/sigma32)